MARCIHQCTVNSKYKYIDWIVLRQASNGRTGFCQKISIQFLLRMLINGLSTVNTNIAWILFSNRLYLLFSIVYSMERSIEMMCLPTDSILFKQKHFQISGKQQSLFAWHRTPYMVYYAWYMLHLQQINAYKIEHIVVIAFDLRNRHINFFPSTQYELHKNEVMKKIEEKLSLLWEFLTQKVSSA